MSPENNVQPTHSTSSGQATDDKLQNPISPLKQIRTFQGDVAEALGRQKESLFSIHETERLKMSSGGSVPNTTPDDSEKRQQFFLLIFGSVFLIALGLLGAWFGYSEFVRKSAPPAIVVPESRLIAVQSEVVINTASTSRDALLSAITEKSSGVSANELRHLVLRNGAGTQAPLLTSSEFFQVFESQAPGSLVRALAPVFMLGTLGRTDDSERASRFFIFELTSFENAFPGMLAWEGNMVEDIGQLLNTAPILKNIGPASVFKDVISRNKDSRVLFAPSAPGATSTEPALLYSFFDRRYLIVTDSLETLRVLIDRLTQELLSR